MKESHWIQTEELGESAAFSIGSRVAPHGLLPLLRLDTSHSVESPQKRAADKDCSLFGSGNERVGRMRQERRIYIRFPLNSSCCLILNGSGGWWVSLKTMLIELGFSMLKVMRLVWGLLLSAFIKRLAQDLIPKVLWNGDKGFSQDLIRSASVSGLPSLFLGNGKQIFVSSEVRYCTESL